MVKFNQNLSDVVQPYLSLIAQNRGSQTFSQPVTPLAGYY